MSDRIPDVHDIQGNVLAGFNTDVLEFVSLTVGDAAAFPSATQWLAGQAEAVTTVAEVRAQRALMKEGRGDAAVTWLCLAVGARMLQAAAPAVQLSDQAFTKGLIDRAPSVLGDRTDPAGWRVGGRDHPVDVLFIVGSNDEGAACTRADQLIATAAAAGFSVTYRETGRRLHGDREQFGFRDGISQPRVIDDDPNGTLSAGQFVVGYPPKPGLDPVQPGIDEDGIVDNGSFLVFRRLAQHVAEFRAFASREATRLAPAFPALSPPHLEALVVGRWPSGAPVRESQSEDPEDDPPDDTFTFANDDGRHCPMGAHIRKVNPRKGPRDVVDIPRMLRRGIPFTNSDADRGLLFVSFQASIVGQFEFLTRQWMNSKINPGPGQDLLVGRSLQERTMQIKGPTGPLTVRTGGGQWITPTGGAYLLALARSGLRKLAGG